MQLNHYLTKLTAKSTAFLAFSSLSSERSAVSSKCQAQSAASCHCWIAWEVVSASGFWQDSYSF